MIVQLLIFALSVLSLGCVSAILRAPWLPEQQPVRVPSVIAHALDEGYNDWSGLV